MRLVFFSITIYARISNYFLLLYSVCCFFDICALDPRFYLTRYPDLYRAGIHTDLGALFHYLQYGFYEHRQAAPPVENTNFDWQYYVNVNGLSNTTTEGAAKTHYINTGHAQQLPYCKKFTIAILLHLYNLNQTDEFIEKINYFMSINYLNNYYIKINIPIDKNLNNSMSKFDTQTSNYINEKVLLNEVLGLAPYHKHLINKDNAKQLYHIAHYLKSKLAIPQEKIQIIFSENRGLDIGGFFITLDQLIKQNLPVDYIIKLHSKTHNAWRSIATSILNLRINKLLTNKQFIHSCSISFNWNEPQTQANLANITVILNKFKLPKKNFRFAAGTMFIVSRHFVDFFSHYNLINLFQSLNMFSNKPSAFETIEHAYERFFGYIATHLNLTPRIIGNIERTSEPLNILNKSHEEMYE